MVRDVRYQPDDTPVKGLGDRVDSLLNERFKSLAFAVAQQQARTLIEVRHTPPAKAYDGQVELADGVDWDPADIPSGYKPYLVWHWEGVWHELMDDRHLTLTPPDYLEHPHGQYWHKVVDPAWAHLYFQDFVTPNAVLNGNAVTGWTGNIIADWQLVSDPVAGTVVVQSGGTYPETGTYAISISGFVEGTQNTSYVLSMYADGAPTLVRMPVMLRGTVTGAPVSWSGIAHIGSDATLTLVLEVGGALDIFALNWSAHRINPVAGTTGSVNVGNVIILDESPPPPAIPPEWGMPPL